MAVVLRYFTEISSFSRTNVKLVEVRPIISATNVYFKELSF